MDTQFTLDEVSKLFEYALYNQQIEAAGLALKSAQVTNLNSHTFLAKALENSYLGHMMLADGLMQFARYDQLDLIFELLQGNSTKVKHIAILSLQLLSDPRALELLNQQMHESDLPTIRESAAGAYQTISRRPVALLDNTVYTHRRLTPLDEMDLDLADFILNRDLSNKVVSDLVKQLFYPMVGMR